jgi:hypothetical protein
LLKQGHLTLPVMRKAVEGKEGTLTEVKANEILDNCIKTLFYSRDEKSLNNVCKILIYFQNVIVHHKKFSNLSKNKQIKSQTVSNIQNYPKLSTS